MEKLHFVSDQPPAPCSFVNSPALIAQLNSCVSDPLIASNPDPSSPDSLWSEERGNLTCLRVQVDNPTPFPLTQWLPVEVDRITIATKKNVSDSIPFFKQELCSNSYVTKVVL